MNEWWKNPTEGFEHESRSKMLKTKDWDQEIRKGVTHKEEHGKQIAGQACLLDNPQKIGTPTEEKWFTPLCNLIFHSANKKKT